MRPVDPTRSRILLAGTPAYDDPALPDVPAVANNLADLFQILTDPNLGGFNMAHCVVAPARSSVAQIGEMLVNAADEAEDLLLFYFSGHGMLGPLRRELYLSLAATRSGMLAFTALPFDAVRDACLNSRATNRVVILDSCYSGRAIGETLAGDSESVLGQIQVAGTYTLASAPANRTALILPGERNTAFTGRMLALLRSGSASAGPLLSLGDIYRHLYTQLLAEGLPVPQQRGTETADLLGLVRNAFATRTPASTVPLPQPRPTHEPRNDTQARRDEFDVIVASSGDRKIQVIKVVRELTSLGLKEANDLVNAAPKAVLRQVTKETADKAKATLEQAGATATVRSSAVRPYPVEASHTAPVVEPGRFDVTLQAAGDNKIQVIRVVRELTSLSLKEANDLVNTAPRAVLQRVTREIADKAKATLEQTGATTDVRSSPVEPVGFDVILNALGDKKIQVIKVVRELTSLGLKEAKDLVEATPKPVLRQVTKETADKAKAALEQAGATATVLFAHRFASTEM